MPSTTDAWNDLNNAVLAVFEDESLSVGDVREALKGVPDPHVRSALHQHVEWGYLEATRGAVRTTYTITETGRRHLANTKAMA